VHRAVLVIDMDALRSHLAGARDEAGEIERALDSAVSEEWEEFHLIARDPNVWELIWDALLMLDREHHERLRTILEQCCAMSTEFINGQGSLYEVLTSDEMLESDARSERDDRHAVGGFVSASDARAFLALARADGLLEEQDAITAAYFRALHPHEKAAQPERALPRLAAAAEGADVQKLMQLIAASERAPERAPQALRGGTAPPPLAASGKTKKPAAKASRAGRAGGKARKPGARAAATERAAPSVLQESQHGANDSALDAEPAARAKTALARALAALSTEDPQAHTARMEELGYLANVLIAGCTHAGRQLRPVEALEAAVATASLGLELWPREASEPTDAAQRLQRIGCDRLFRGAWPVLQSDVVLPARQTLERAVSLYDADDARSLTKLVRSDNVFGLRELCEASDLGLSGEAFEALLALAEPLPWLSTSDAAQHPSRWIDSRAALLLARRHIAAGGP
jgi:hypothetical protein